MRLRNESSGYITILAVLILSAVCLAVTASLIDTSVFGQKSINASQQSTQARAIATGCAEEALELIHDATSYTGTGTLVINGSTCSYTVTSTGSTTRTIDASVTVGNATRKVKVYATIGTTSISITQWQEIL